jgi:hypothetical protein
MKFENMNTYVSGEQLSQLHIVGVTAATATS